MQSTPVYVINLKRHHERREAIGRHLGDLGIEFEIIEGVDGKELGSELLQSVLPTSNTMPIGHIGCYLSHVKVYERIINESRPVALVLEDDARLGKDAAALLRALSPDNIFFDYCFLDSENFNEEGPVFYDATSARELALGIKAVRLSHGPQAMHAYMISLSAAKRRLEVAFPIVKPIDTYTHLPYPSKHYAIVSPKLAWVSEFGLTSSTYDRNQETSEMSLAFLRRSVAYYKIRDLLHLDFIRAKRDVWNATRSGRLESGRAWRRLPKGKEIVFD